jgi:hypothetical protein
LAQPQNWPPAFAPDFAARSRIVPLQVADCGPVVGLAAFKV